MSKASIQVIKDAAGNPSYVLAVKDGKSLKVSYDINQGFTFEGNRSLIPSITEMLKLVYPAELPNVITQDFENVDMLRISSSGEGIGYWNAFTVPQNEVWELYGAYFLGASIQTTSINLITPTPYLQIPLEIQAAANTMLYRPYFPKLIKSGWHISMNLTNDAGADTETLYIYFRRHFL